MNISDNILKTYRARDNFHKYGWRVRMNISDNILKTYRARDIFYKYVSGVAIEHFRQYSEDIPGKRLFS